VKTKPSFTQRYLSPGDRLGEILFGLIMVLTFTLTAGVTVKESPDAVHELLLATLGCNLAWGIIDGAFYLMNVILDRSRYTTTLLAVQNAHDAQKEIQIIHDYFEETFDALPDTEKGARLYQELAEAAKKAIYKSNTLTKEDWMGAIASGWLVILSTLPAAIPFFFIKDAFWALRVSNLLLLVLLFAAGITWSKYAHTNRWVTGLVFLALGILLVGIAIALGG